MKASKELFTGPWVWELPESDAKRANDDTKSANTEGVASFGQVSESKPVKSETYAKGAKEEVLAYFGTEEGTL